MRLTAQRILADSLRNDFESEEPSGWEPGVARARRRLICVRIGRRRGRAIE
ncbi:hypothetical protein [Nonomuraea sediminis]|uniref:hypothetical protein n=1 Tax=Nonomuraea sediminis TaxID=2835864 RepID=UPI002029E77F|nr:hypothetical protein [Nonomuraea sediminis]